MAIAVAMRARAKTETPIPIPAFAPVERELSVLFEVAEGVPNEEVKMVDVESVLVVDAKSVACHRIETPKALTAIPDVSENSVKDVTVTVPLG